MFYKNPVVMGEFVSDSGMLLRKGQTGLSKVNQRRVHKAIRRARGVGLLPTTYRHPQLLGRGAGGVMSKI
jgi:small subunit ribosomal protein S18